MQIKLNNELSSETGEREENPSPFVQVGRNIEEPPAVLFVKTDGSNAVHSHGERVRLCIRCDIPVIVYGQLSPCEHAFCLDCAKSENICFICERNVEKIQPVELIAPLYICSVEICLKSFVGMEAFESHVKEVHCKILKPKQSPASA